MRLIGRKTDGGDPVFELAAAGGTEDRNLLAVRRKSGRDEAIADKIPPELAVAVRAPLRIELRKLHFQKIKLLRPIHGVPELESCGGNVEVVPFVAIFGNQCSLAVSR